MPKVPENSKQDISEALRSLKERLDKQPISKDVDNKANEEAQAIANESYEVQEREKAEIERLRQHNEDLAQNRDQRKTYAKHVLRYLVCYSAFVAALLVMSGFNFCGFSLPDGVLATLVGSTAAAAIGLVFAVVNGLFGNINKK